MISKFCKIFLGCQFAFLIFIADESAYANHPLLPNLRSESESSSPTIDYSIVGGQPARPYENVTQSTMALITKVNEKPDAQCTGTLISRNLVITAAHCLQFEDKNSLWIHNGAKLPDNFNGLMKVSEIRSHPDFRMVYDQNHEVVTSENDIALIRLEKEIIFDPLHKMQPVALIKDIHNLNPGRILLLAGYGALNDNSDPLFPQQLYKVKVPIVKLWNKVIVADQTQGNGACFGDSGGPAYLETIRGLFLAGITRGPHDKARDCHHWGEFTQVAPFQNFILQSAEEMRADPPQFIEL